MVHDAGQQLGNYRLIHLLGRGNWASVYLGEHLYLHTQAAIKVLHGQLESSDLEGFLTEARAIARLRHPHIVHVLDFGVQDGVPFLVMEYAPGGSLRQRHPKGTQLSFDTVLSYVKQIALALQYTHDQKLIHRDIKPENLLLGPDNEVLLSDFGIAIIAQSSHYQTIQETAGSIAYMAPEQMNGHPHPASDQYALGIVVYEWLSGERPFSGSFTEVAAKQTLVAPPPLHEKVPTIPSVVEHVVLKALAKAPEHRFAQVQDFALALEEASKAESSARTILAPPSEERSVEPRQTSLSNLPVLLTPLIGREQDVAAACALLSRPDVRLLTLLGTGGIGKTRLSLQVATEMHPHFADGVCFVSLAPIRDPELVLPTIAQTLKLQESSNQAPLDLLKAFLREKHLLLLLDNIEQVVTAAPQLEELLSACPRLNILVTSRALLHLQAEHVFPVPPLALPDLAQLPESERLAQYPAVALFAERARAIQPSFQLTPANAQAIAEICVRLDGLPLTIELAAARIRLLPPQALLSRLSQRLQVLTGGARTLPERQQTLRNTLKWSYDLLEPEEQRLFRRLAVFVGGWTLDAAEAVANAGQPPDLARLSVLDGVASLLDKSLLQIEQNGGEEPRFGMLEMIREYGLECLAASGEMEAVRQAHAEYYLALAEETEPEGTREQTAWLDHLEREQDNLRAALGWFLEQGESGRRKEMALRLGGALKRFWQVRGHWREGRTFLERALVGSEAIAAPVRAKALSAAAHLASIQGEYSRAHALLEENLALLRELGDRRGISHSLHMLGVVALQRGHYAAARSLTEEALTLFKEMDNQGNVAWSLSNLAHLAILQGEYARARSLAEKGLALFRKVGNKKGIATSLNLLAYRAIYQGEYIQAHTLLEESLALLRELDDKEGFIFSFLLSGLLALNQDDAATAHSLLEQSLAISREEGNRWGIARSLFLLARGAALQSDNTAAYVLYEESLAFAMEVSDQWGIASDLEGLAGVVAAQGELTWAAHLWGAAAALREAIGAPLPPVERAAYEQAVAAAGGQLGETAFAAAWAEGRIMTPEQALAAKGRTAISPAAPTPRASSPIPPTKSLVRYPDGLTLREVEVLRLVAQGLTDAQIAEQLVISRRTVNWYLTAIYSKIQVSSRSAATRYALEHNLV